MDYDDGQWQHMPDGKGIIFLYIYMYNFWYHARFHGQHKAPPEVVVIHISASISIASAPTILFIDPMVKSPGTVSMFLVRNFGA